MGEGSGLECKIIVNEIILFGGTVQTRLPNEPL